MSAGMVIPAVWAYWRRSARVRIGAGAGGGGGLGGGAGVVQDGAGEADGLADGGGVDAEQAGDLVSGQGQALVQEGGQDVVGEVELAAVGHGPAGAAAGAAPFFEEGGLAAGLPGQGQGGDQSGQV